jgi:serine/threonine protein kinase
MMNRKRTYHPTGTLIANRYEVVQGPYENPTLVGGMGIVYLCVDRAEEGRPVALKTFKPKYLPDRSTRDRFLREGTTWIELGRHPHIVCCHEVIQPGVDLQVYFILELVAAAENKPDASLCGWLLPGKPVAVEQSLLFVLHITRGMKHAVAKIPGLVHRDLKPGNVLVGRDGDARVTDFGLAGILSELPDEADKELQDDELLVQGRLRTITRGFVGTPEYTAPEQFEGRVDVRSDIYAFGCILYEMLTGKRPFQVICRTQEERLEKYRHCHVKEKPRPLRSLVPSITGTVEELVTCCLEKDPVARPRDWSEVEMRVGEVYRKVMKRDVPNEVAGKADSRVEWVASGWSYTVIGSSYFAIGKFDVAVRYFKRVKEIGQDERERQLEGAGLGGLGNAYVCLSDYRQAIDCHEQHLAIVREIGDRIGEGDTLGNLGIAYNSLGDHKRAIEFHEQHLTIAREVGNRAGEGRALGNLGNAYKDIGDYRQAIDYHEQDLAIAREMGDRSGEGLAFGGLGNAYDCLGEYRRAIDYHEQHLSIAREIGDRLGEGTALGNLGIAYYNLGEYRRAIEYYEQHLAIAREIGEVMGVAIASYNLADAFTEEGQRVQALPHAEYAAKVFSEIGHTEYVQKAQQLIAQLRSLKS